MKKIKTIVLAAGEGTRMRSKKSKILHEILGMPMVAHVIDTSKKAGSDEVCVVIGHKADEVRAALAGEAVVFVEQKERLGTGHAVMMAEDFIGDDGTILIVYGDTPAITPEMLGELIQRHNQTGSRGTFVTTRLENVEGYGRVIREYGEFVKVVEHKDATEEERKTKEVNVGIYCFEAADLKEALKEISNDNVQNEYYLPDVITVLMKKGKKVAPALFEDFEQFEGINTKVQLANVTKIMQRQINEKHMLNGVNIVSPETTFIDRDVQIEADATILPGTILEKGTIICEDAVVGPNAKVTASKIGPGCTVLSSVLLQAEMEEGSDCGPYAYLRPGTKLGKNVHVGDFVEIKNATVGAGTKIPHLTYIGDAEVGAGANLGCGTVTANYDGVKKFITKIGDGAFIGCHTCLVSPVNVGEDAYTAAGSVITSDVSAGALAIARSKQSEKKDWREKSGKKRPLKKK